LSDGIVVAIISGVGTLLVAILSYVGNRKGAKEANDANAKLIAYRIQQLEDKVSQHNRVIERTFRLEGRMDEVEHDIRDLKKG
jgi:hypothetical protein